MISIILALCAFDDLPLRVASLGAATAGDHVYAYGGHAGKQHTYDEKTASGRFFRAKRSGGKWEELPSGPRAQGVALVAHREQVIRVGGMQPRNKEGEKADLHSLKSVQRYDPDAKKWIDLPDLPSGRSSHEAAVIGDTLYVVGGWEMRGKGQASLWHKTALSLDLLAKDAKWKEFDQPFQRRALGMAACGGKLHVVGGLGEKESTSRVDLYDPKSGKWTSGPDLPGESKHGFSPAASEADGRLYVSTSDGVLHRLKADGKGWEKAGKTSERLVHRLVPGSKGKLLLIGGGTASVEEATPESSR